MSWRAGKYGKRGLGSGDFPEPSVGVPNSPPGVLTANSFFVDALPPCVLTQDGGLTGCSWPPCGRLARGAKFFLLPQGEEKMRPQPQARLGEDWLAVCGGLLIFAHSPYGDFRWCRFPGLLRVKTQVWLNHPARLALRLENPLTHSMGKACRCTFYLSPLG